MPDVTRERSRQRERGSTHSSSSFSIGAAATHERTVESASIASFRMRSFGATIPASAAQPLKVRGSASVRARGN